MKKLLLVLLLGTLVSADLSAATIKVNSRDFTSEPTMRRRTTLTLEEEGAVVAGPWLIAGDSVAKFTDTNGVAYYSNVLAGAYRLDIAGTPGRSFPITVPDTNGLLNASALVNSTNVNTDFYTAAQTDARIIELATGGSGGTSTGAVVSITQQQLAAGTNTFSGAATLSSLTAASPLSVNLLGGSLTSGNSALGASGLTVTGGGSLTPSGFFGNASGVSNTPTAVVSYNSVYTTNTPTRSINRRRAGVAPKLVISSFNIWPSSSLLFHATNSAQEGVNAAADGNFMRWATNTLYWYATNGMRDYGWDAIELDDGWQERTNNVLTWNTNTFPMGMPAYCAFAHSLGFKVYLYSAYTTNTCNTNGVSSPIDKVYADLQTMMSWGADGIKFDTCDLGHSSWTDAAGYRDYITRYMRIAAQSVEDFQETVVATNGRPRPFWTMAPMTIQSMNPPLGTINYDAADFLNSYFLSWPVASIDQGTNYIANMMVLAKLTMDAQAFTGEGRTVGLESFYANVIGGVNEQTAGNWTNILNIYSAVCSPVIGRFGTWSYGTITNATAAENPNPGSPIKALETYGRYWTNAAYLEILRDPTTIPAKVIWSNNLVELWVRPLGGEDPGEDCAVYLLNPRASNLDTNITVTFANWGGKGGQRYVRSDPWTGMEWETTGSFTVNVKSNTVHCYRIKRQPKPAANDSVSLRYMLYSPTAGTVFADQANFPSPHFLSDAIYMPNTAIQYFTVPIPWWVTNATIKFGAATHTSTTNQWAWSIATRSYPPTGRIVGTSVDGTIVTALNPYTTIITNVSFSVTNCPKEALITWQIPTNTTGNRWIIGPINLEYR